MNSQYYYSHLLNLTHIKLFSCDVAKFSDTSSRYLYPSVVKFYVQLFSFIISSSSQMLNLFLIVISATSAELEIMERQQSRTKLVLGRSHSEHYVVRYPELTVEQILKLPSDATHGDNDNSLTVIVGIWRRPQYLAQMIDSLLNQTQKITEIWLTMFASPVERNLTREVLTQRRRDQDRIKFIRGDPQFTYYGRFMQALGVRTKWVAILDDDSIPGIRYFELCMHAAQTEQYKGANIFGMKGHNAFDNPPSNKQHGYAGVLGGQVIMKQVDVIGGIWFTKTELVKLMFYPRILTFGSAEDFQWCYAVQVYGNGACLAMPTHRERQWVGYPQNYGAISTAGDTTGTIPGTWQARGLVEASLYERGLVRENDKLNWKSSGPGIMFFAQNLASCSKLKSLVSHVTKKKLMRHVCVVTESLPGDVNDERLAAEFGCTITNVGWRNAGFQKEFQRTPVRGIDIRADVGRSLYHILLSANPLLVIATSPINNDALLSLAEICRDLNYPLFLWIDEEDLLTLEKDRYLLKHKWRVGLVEQLAEFITESELVMLNLINHIATNFNNRTQGVKLVDISKILENKNKFI